MDPWRRELFDRHRSVVAGMARDRSGGNHSVADDLEAAGLWALWLAAESFDADVATFKTWARRNIAWAMADWLRESSPFNHHKTHGAAGLPGFEPVPRDRAGAGP